VIPTKQSNANTTSGDQAFNLFGVLLNFLVTPDETGPEISLFKGALPPGVAIPLHSHAEPEVLYVLEGSLEVYRESGLSQGWSTTQPGGVLPIPRQVAKPFEAGQMPAPPSPEHMQQLFAAAAKYHFWMGSPEENAAIGISFG
jgi:quercetin dioxygenase-like cupin family protein